VSLRCLLVVDADPAVHDLLGGILKRDDRLIQDAFDGREALDCLRGSACDVVVAGQGRNGLGGLDLLRRVRSVRPEARVIVTGEPDPVKVLGAIRQRAYSYFQKPLMKDDIRITSARREWTSLDLRCKIDAAERTTQFLREIQADLPPQKRDDVAAAFRELLLNAIEHGGKSDPRKRVRVSLLRTARSVIVLIHDPGTGFSLDLLPHAAIANPDECPTRHLEVRAEHGQRPGGFGILMTRNLVDELVYNERGNAVVFVKYL
jgi:anti-sigma regulatory factor (Ser/Thr protein kinase)